MIWTPAGYIRIKSIAHHGHGIGFSVQHRNFCHHSLCLSSLIFSAVRHEHTAGSDGTVKHLYQTLLRTGIQICKHIQPLFLRVCRSLLRTFQDISFLVWNIYQNFCLLMSTIGIQERTGNIYNFFISPFENQTRFFCNNGYNNSLQILLIGIFHEFIYIFRVNHNSHTLLRFRNSNFCSVKTCIFFRNLIQIYLKTGCQFTDCNRNSACTKVITFLNQPADFFSAEHTLNLTLCRSIAFLNFRTTHFNGCFCMNLGGTGSTTNTITSGTSAQQDDNITRIRVFSLNRTSWSRTENSTDFHTFCHIIRMINFFYISGCQTDLVTVRTITVCCASNQLLLRQFSFQCLFNRHCRISCTGYTHSLIYISTS